MPLPEHTTLNWGPWYRRSPYFEATLRAGCSAYDIYQHMYHPNTYGDPVEEYWALLNDVTVWDVAVERIVEITGRDASAFTNMLTCRDLTKCAVGQGKYVLITAEDGGIVNDPVLLRVEENRWWLALADSDAGLWARGVATGSGMDVKVRSIIATNGSLPEKEEQKVAVVPIGRLRSYIERAPAGRVDVSAVRRALKL